MNKNEDEIIINKKNFNQINFKNNKIIISLDIQSPPIELNENDLNKSLNIFFETMINLKNDTKEIILVYLPAPTSTLNLKNPIYFQKYFNENTPSSVTKEELETRVEVFITKQKIKVESLQEEANFCESKNFNIEKQFKLESSYIIKELIYELENDLKIGFVWEDLKKYLDKND